MSQLCHVPSVSCLKCLLSQVFHVPNVSCPECLISKVCLGTVLHFFYQIQFGLPFSNMVRFQFFFKIKIILYLPSRYIPIFFYEKPNQYKKLLFLFVCSFFSAPK